MILFTIIAIILAVMLIFGVFTLVVGGATFGIVFADIIVCVGIIVLIVRAIMKRKK